MHIRLSILGAAALACSAVAPAERATEAEPVRQGFELLVLEPPTPVRVGDRVLIAYELHLTNFASRPLTLERLRLFGARSSQPILDLSGQALAAAVGHAGPMPQDRLEVRPGGRAAVYLDAPVDIGEAPSSVRHAVEYRLDDTEGPTRVRVEGRVRLDSRPLPVLSPPLHGGPWTAVYDPGLERGHRRVFYAVAGRARIPGRFAIDWMPAKAEPGGEAASGLGAAVLAVADGVVVSTRDGIAEPASAAARPATSLADAAGNYVVIDIGGSRFAHYEHLLPGLAVRPGQTVRRGQVIGRLGSTGQSSRPHLHFHLADSASSLDAEGLPYLLTGARTLGSYGSIAAVDSGEAWRPVLRRSSEPLFPEPNAVIAFADRVDVADEPAGPPTRPVRPRTSSGSTD